MGDGVKVGPVDFSQQFAASDSIGNIVWRKGDLGRVRLPDFWPENSCRTLVELGPAFQDKYAAS
jgi:hypothetical protein